MPGGFKLVGSLAEDVKGKVRRYAVSSAHASRLAIGDWVAKTGTADATGLSYVDTGTAGSALTGPIVGFEPLFATESFQDTGLPAGVGGYALVYEDPRAEYEVDVSNGPLAAADVGLNVNLLATAATQSGGLTFSNMTVNATGKDTTATLNFNVLALLKDEAGVLGNRARVRLNNSTAISGATGV